MKNIKVPKRIAKSIIKLAYLDLIDNSIRKITKFNGLSHIDLDGYENDNDRVKFTYGGKKCTLFGVWLPYIKGDKPNSLPVTVFARHNNASTLWDITIDARDLRIKTLDRIAYEVYDYCKGEDDEDYEIAIKDSIAGWMDNYREFMS